MTNDFIRREDVIAEINKRSLYICDDDFGVIIHAENVINAIPAADVRPVVRGRWVDGKCDNCGEHAPYWCLATTFHESNYCPNCGADMRPSEEPESLTYIPPEERGGVDDG